MNHTSRQRRILEQTGVMDVGGAAPAAVEPAQAAAPVDANPGISMEQGTDVDFITLAMAQLNEVTQELPGIIQKAAADQAPYATGLTKVAEGLGKLGQQLGNLKEKLVQQAGEAPEPSVPSAPPPAPEPAPAPAPAPPAPAPAPMESHVPSAPNAMDPNDDDFEVNYGSPLKYGYTMVDGRWIMPENRFLHQLDSIFEDGGVAGRDVSQKMTTVWTKSEHQGGKTGEPSKRGGASEAGDSAFKDEGKGKSKVKGQGYGHTGGFS